MRVLKVFLDAPHAEISGVEITRQIGIKSGTLYPILIRLEEAGWLESRWEVVDPRHVGRPRRRYYRMTGDGHRVALAALASLQVGQAMPAWNS